MSQFDFLDEKARDIIQSRILKGMIGPGSDTWGVEDKEEIISDYPLQRYFSGIVFPNKTICKTIDEKENTEAQSDAPIGSTETNEEDFQRPKENETKLSGIANPNDDELKISQNNFFPTNIGLSIALQKDIKTIDVTFSFGLYYQPKQSEIKIKINQAGYLAVFSPQIQAYTETVKTTKQLIKQRYRWFLGGLDVLTKYGYTKATKEDIFGHALYLTFFMAIMGTLIFGFTFNNFQITYTNIMLIPIALATINYVTSLIGLAFVENLTKKDVVIRATILPELLYCIFLELVRWKAYLAKCFTKKRKW